MQAQTNRPIWLFLFALGCIPELDDRPSAIETRRIIAVIAEPPEAEPGDEVSFRVAVASPEGPVEEPSAYWSFCTTKKGLAENNAVDAACWDEEYSHFGGPLSEIAVAIPEDACTRYGPEVSDDGQRPNDPDASGGYYQPVRVAIPELAAFGFERLSCRLPNAPPDIVDAFESAYRFNTNPLIADLRIEGAAGSDVAQASGRVSIRLAIDAASRERFVRYDQTSVSLIELEEELRASFFTNAGKLDRDVVSLDADAVDVGWSLPETAGEATVWIVVRDSRGGVAATHRAITVE